MLLRSYPKPAEGEVAATCQSYTSNELEFIISIQIILIESTEFYYFNGFETLFNGTKL